MLSYQQTQDIFDVLVAELKAANYLNLTYLCRKLRLWGEDQVSPTDEFLVAVKKKLAPRKIDEDFLKQVYAQVFHTGRIPKNRHHIALTCDLTLNAKPTSPLLEFWMDLDKLAELTNLHFGIHPPYRFKVPYEVRNEMDGSRFSPDGIREIQIKYNTHSVVNSVEKPEKWSSFFLVAGIVCGIISVAALMIVTLALMAIMTMSSVGIYTLGGVGLLAGLASCSFLYFFTDKNTYTSPTANLDQGQDLFLVFKEHFEATLREHYNGILPEERFKILEEDLPALNP